MDLGSLIGLVLGFGVVVYGMLLGGPMSMYVDMPSVYHHSGVPCSSA